MRANRLLPTLLLALATVAAGCQTTKEGKEGETTGERSRRKEAGGTAIGAATGAAVGSQVGNKEQRARNAAIGAVVGGIAGNRVGAYMDRQEEELREKLKGTGVSVTRKGDKIELNMPGEITFETGKATVDEHFRPVLDSVAAVLKKYDDTGIQVIGHTDSKGNPATNQTLSEQRARAVANILQGEGVQKERFEVEGLGESQPVADNATASGRAQNRRVELELYPIVAH